MSLICVYLKRICNEVSKNANVSSKHKTIIQWYIMFQPKSIV